MVYFILTLLSVSIGLVIAFCWIGTLLVEEEIETLEGGTEPEVDWVDPLMPLGDIDWDAGMKELVAA